jgi:hypothetical protein
MAAAVNSWRTRGAASFASYACNAERSSRWRAQSLSPSALYRR